MNVASGEVLLPAAKAFGDRGFHDPIVVHARVPRALPVSGRARLVLLLRDAARPAQSCSIDHPLSGCATVDWSDDPSRPHVPASGVFENSVTLPLSTGRRKLFLRQSGALAPRADPFTPG